MPTYDYECGYCGYVFEKILNMSNNKKPEKEACPKCGNFHVKQIITTINMKTRYGLDDARKKLPDDFKETMRYIKKGNPGNKMKDY